MKKLAVIGSINMDMVVRVDQFPQPGETRRGDRFAIVPGGKGANQAVALGRLGADVAMAGLVGDDASGEAYLRNFRENGVSVDAVGTARGETTGTAVIEVDHAGENHIIIVPGANERCDLEWLDRALPAIIDRDIFLLQLEIPHDTVFEAIRRLRAAGKTVVLDPAPASAIPVDLLRDVDYITPNETELIAITQSMGEGADIRARMQWLRAHGVGAVIAKSGADGAYICADSGIAHVPGFKVAPVDTTAAGDTFNAGFACALAQGMDIPRAVRFANAAAAISVTAAGAQGGMPARDMVEKLLQSSV
ncbi:MAG: ribokinase [Christensenellales bacterium]|jgi:ribokinase